MASLVNPIDGRPSSSPARADARASGDNAGSTPNRERPTAPGSWLPFPSSFAQQLPDPDVEAESPQQDAGTDQRYFEKLREIHNFGDDHDASRPPNNLFQGSSRREPYIESEIVQRLLATEEADGLLNEYRSMSASFPFVPLAQAITAHELHSSKPMLFLAIITMASWRDHRQQMALDELYRREFANRTIIRPRRTLSLVQSTLVYLSWYVVSLHVWSLADRL